MGKIKIETKGLIVNGELKDWNIYIQDLNKGSGAYLILLTSPNGLEGYDDWVEDFSALFGYFEEAKWNVDWQEGV